MHIKLLPAVLLTSVLAVCLVLTTHGGRSDASPVAVAPSEADPFFVSPLRALRQYLRLKKLSAEDWTWENDRATLRGTAARGDRVGKPSALIESIRVTASGRNLQIEPKRYVFVIENAHTQPGAKKPEFDSYACAILVLRMDVDHWHVESLTRFDESRYDGGTRWAKNCANYSVSWEGGYPALTREATFGPYADGTHRTTTQKVSRSLGQYQLSSVSPDSMRVAGTRRQ